MSDWFATSTCCKLYFTPKTNAYTYLILRNGNPKGIAYVEFVDDKSASKAIMSLDQTELQGFKISVAISAPPVKPSSNRGAVNALLTLGQGRRNQTNKG